MDKKFHFHDNRRVKTTKFGGEFLGIRCSEVDEFNYSRASISRYCVPGRCDTYNFCWQDQDCGTVTYYTEGGSLPLTQALDMLAVDIDLEPVRKMLIEAISENLPYGYSRDLVERLLPMIAPKSKALRDCKKALAKVKARREKAVAEKKAQREATEACELA